ncbi:MAG: class I SAM-dependent methyltransferase [Planctomycetota bacterium]
MSDMNELSSGEFYDNYWLTSPDFSAQNPSSIFRREWVVSWSRKLPWKTHLDVGCGNGLLISCIHQACNGAGHHTGIDVSPKVIERNQKALPQHRFMVKDISHDALDGSFDLVTCLEVLEHLPVESAEQAVSTLAASCSEGGHLLITVPTGKIHATERAFGHIRHFNLEDLKGLFLRHGVHAVSAHQWGWPFHDLSRELANIHPQGSLRTFASDKPSPLSSSIFSLWTRLNRFNSHRKGQQLLFVGRKTGG